MSVLAGGGSPALAPAVLRPDAAPPSGTAQSADGEGTAAPTGKAPPGACRAARPSAGSRPGCSRPAGTSPGLTRTRTQTWAARGWPGGTTWPGGEESPRGWRRGVRLGVRRALVIFAVPARAPVGDTIPGTPRSSRCSRPLGISAGRGGRGASGDGRCWTMTGGRPSMGWLERKLDGLFPWHPRPGAGGRRYETMHDSSSSQQAPRHRLRPGPHCATSTQGAAGLVIPVMATCARSPATTSSPSSGSFTGPPPLPTSSWHMRTLFAFCKRQEGDLRPPGPGHPGRRAHLGGVIQPLSQRRSRSQAAEAATAPAARLVLVLAAMHAARVQGDPRDPAR